jgi:hypothetical protein
MRRERPSKSDITCILFVIQPVCTAYLIKDIHQSSPIIFKKKVREDKVKKSTQLGSEHSMTE